MRVRFGCAILVALALTSLPARAADRVKATLGYKQKGATLTGCPDEDTFRGLVAARLGYDPFVSSGSLALSVELGRRGNEIVGRLILIDEDKKKNSDRTLRAGADECFELATSLALAAAVALDPDAVQAHTESPPQTSEPPAPTKPPVPVPAPAPIPVPVPVPEPAKPPATPPRYFDHGVRIELAGVLPVGIVPAPRGGLRLGAALDAGIFAIGLEGSFLFPSTRESRYGNVSAYVVHGSLVPCIHPAELASVLVDFCAVGSLGMMRSDASNVSRAAPARDLFATVGPRLALLVLLSRSFGVGASADVPVTLSRIHLDIEDGGQRHEVWASSRVGFVGGISLALRFE